LVRTLPALNIIFLFFSLSGGLAGIFDSSLASQSGGFISSARWNLKKKVPSNRDEAKEESTPDMSWHWRICGTFSNGAVLLPTNDIVGDFAVLYSLILESVEYI
jgi:hypothetical protein